ncbi:copper chaperone PCu(A)C [Betaproteobacteria bacterium]|nr:copper chaperone PCu(A)C [Betaproteobacteria bacterium]
MILTLIISTIFTLNLPFVIANDATEVINISGGHTNVIRPGQNTIAIYLDTIENSSNEDIDLIAASSPFAKNIEIHSMQIVDNVMKMKKQEKITISANSKVSLGKKNPNNYHLMVFDVSPQITERNKFTINLSFSNGEKLQTEISVKKHTENQHNHH